MTPIGASDTGLTGAYCIKANTVYDPINSCQTNGPTRAIRRARTAGRSTGSDRRALGLRAEDAVVDLLVARGYEILWRNLRLGPLEIDVVARKGSLGVLVEVRTRGAGAYVKALESVDAKKRARLLRGAERLWRERLSKVDGIERMRLDVAAVRVRGGGPGGRVRRRGVHRA